MAKDQPDDQDGAGDADRSGDVAELEATTDDGVATLSIDGVDAPIALSDDIQAAVDDRDDVALEDIARAAVPGQARADYSAHAQTDEGDSTTVPVQDRRDWELTSNRYSGARRFQFIEDDTISKLNKNSVYYTERVAEWILAKDDLVPAIKERIKALLIGEGGLSVDPADPDTEADQRLAEHLEDLFTTDVRPGNVVDEVLEENMKNARAVLRSTDLDPLDLEHLAYFRDGVTGEEIYWQSDVRVATFDVDEARESGSGTITEIGLEEQDIDGQPLVIGEHVFEAELYSKPPLEAVADTVVNKIQMQRLKARKAEITSFGGIYVKVNPPAYLPEEEYFDRVETDDGDKITKLERALNQNLDNAFDWAKGYQSGTTGAIPMHWDVEQVELPEGDQPLDEQIRGYNQAISRRLLLPLDLVELQEGAELSRETLMRTLLTTIQGWRQEVIRVFEDFAETQKDIHDLEGEVEFSYPPLNDANIEAITKLLNFAGVLGASSGELRQLVNQIEGVDLEVDDQGGEEAPPMGGPEEPDERGQQMRDFLEDQQPTEEAEGPEADEPDHDLPTSREEAMRRGWSPVAEIDAADAWPDDAMVFPNMGGDPFVDQEMLEVFVDALRDAGADDVWIGDEPAGEESGIHDRPIAVTGLTETEARVVWDVFKNDAVGLSGPRPTSSSEAIQGQDGEDFEADVFQVRAPEDEADRFDDDVLGIGIDFPNSPVYVDWRNSVFPDELDHPHVSIYGTIDDLEQATGNIVEPMETIGIEAAEAMVPDPDLKRMRAAQDIDLTPPEQAQDNAQTVLDWRADPDKDVRGMTSVGWNRAEQLAEGGELSPNDVKQMAQFNRHRQNGDVDPEHEGEPWRDPGRVAWLGWGGDAGIDWAIETSQQLQDQDDAEASEASPTRRTLLQSSSHWKEGQKVETDEGTEGVVVEIRESDFTGPDGSDVEASEDDPAFVVATVDGAEVFRADELQSGDWGGDAEDPAADLADEAMAMNAALEAAIDDGHHAITDGTLKAGPTDWDFPESWEESETPARLILLDAWAGMNGQFDCPSGDCCKGTMRRQGMSERASDQFCAAMKDRVLLWEGWRRGGASKVDGDLHAAHRFRGPDNLREAAVQTRRTIEDQVQPGQTVQVVRRDGDRYQIVIHDRDGDIAGSMTVSESAHDDDGVYVIVGADDIFEDISLFNGAGAIRGSDAGIGQRIRGLLEQLRGGAGN